MDALTIGLVKETIGGDFHVLPGLGKPSFRGAIKAIHIREDREIAEAEPSEVEHHQYLVVELEWVALNDAEGFTMVQENKVFEYALSTLDWFSKDHRRAYVIQSHSEELTLIFLPAGCKHNLRYDQVKGFSI